MNGAEFLVKTLEAMGVDVIFGYPGGAIMPVYDAFVGSKLRHILVRHEQAAVLAADGYARVTGRVGVCIATSGPGATNLVTGLANAYLDSVPVVAITGQVPTALMGTDAFQEVDIFGITMPVVKHSFLVRRVADLPRVVHQAFRIARSGRPGPVLIDLPKDVTIAPLDHDISAPDLPAVPVPEATSLASAAALLRSASRPIVYAGGGLRWADAVAEFRAFVRTGGLPTVATLMGLGAPDPDHELHLGMLGMHGLKAANLAVQESDLLVCVGARFDDRVTGKLAEFAPNARVIHLDVDPAEVGKLRRPDASVIGDLRVSLRALTQTLDIEPWRDACRTWRSKWTWDYATDGDRIDAPRFLRDLSEAADAETVFACDVGQHQMWVAQHCRLARPEQHLTSGGLGTMGYGMPAAIGAQFAEHGARVINVTGDGSIMMNFQELATIRRYGLPIRIVVLDNKALGMVRQWQELFFRGRYSEVDLSDNPDFVQVAASFGIPGFRLDRPGDTADAIDRILQQPGPLLVHVAIDPAANVWPLVPPGQPNHRMLEGVSR